MKRTLFLILAGTLMAVMMAGLLAQCASSTAGTTTTAAPASATTTSSPSPTAGAGTTAGAPTTAGATTVDTATPEDYKTTMAAWVTGPLQSLDTSVFGISDPANATAAQIDAVAAFVTQARAALDQLKAIRPSAEAAVPHAQFVQAFAGLIDATDKYVTAMRNKDASGLLAVEQAMATAQTQISQLMSTLSPMIGLTPATT